MAALFSIPPLLYLYETELRAGSTGGPHDPVEFFGYVLLFPLWFIPVPPVFDFEKWRSGHDRRAFDEVVRDGLEMATLAVLKLWAVGLVLPLMPASPTGSTSLLVIHGWNLATFVLLFFMLSSLYELCVAGVMIFGYDLPRPFDRTLLSCGLLDFFRRWNVYWKDMVVKLVFLPIMVRYRKANRTLVLLAAGAMTLSASFLLDWWQVSWLGKSSISAGRGLCWAIFGTLVTIELAVEHRLANRRFHPVVKGVGIAVTLIAASTLFALPYTSAPGDFLESLVGLGPFPASRFPIGR